MYRTIFIHLLMALLYLFIMSACTPRTGGKGSGSTPGGGGGTSDCSEKGGDTDQDGFCDDADNDDDGDSVSDADEVANGTDPKVADSDGDGADDYCEKLKNTSPLDLTQYPESCEVDKDSLLAACMVYDMQKKQDEYYANNFVNQSCTVTEATEDLDTEDCAEDCNSSIVYDENGSPNVDALRSCLERCSATAESASVNNADACTNSSTTIAPDTCNNFGVLEDATLQTLQIEVTAGITYRNHLFVQNGILSFGSWNGWHKKGYNTMSPNAPDMVVAGAVVITIDVPYPAISVGPALGVTLPVHKHKYYKEHMIGAEASEGRDCPAEVQNKATVKINGSSYVWLYPGQLPFKILEYQEPYMFGSDCVLNITGGSYGASAANNFSTRTHIMLIENTEINKEHNSKCKAKTLKFALSYYKEVPKEGEADNAFGYTDAELENLCRDVL